MSEEIQKGPDQENKGKLHQLFDDNFLDYTSYVIRERAIPDVDDGLKPVQRRLLQTLNNMNDGRYHKVANVVGETMKLHPHGDQSIFAALVNLANKGFLIDRQGNFGNIFTGDQASAARYIECRLTPLAIETMFNKDITILIDSYDGRMQEAVTLPAKIPLLLALGAEGIAVGMATKIMPHNFSELLKAQIDYLRGNDFTLYPDFPRGGIVDINEYNHGNGKIRCRAKMEKTDSKTITITELPYNITTQSLIDSVEKAVKNSKLKISSINDYTAETVEVEIKLPRGVQVEETIDALYAFTDCEVSVSPNLMVIRENMPCQLKVEEILRRNTDKLLGYLQKELEIEFDRLKGKLHARRLEQIFIEERIYKEIEEETVYSAVVDAVLKSLLPFADELDKEVSREDVERLLEIKIRRISRYDINRQKKEIKELEKNIRRITKDLKDMVAFTVNYIEGLLAKFGSLFPRRSKLKHFDEVIPRKAALSNLIVSYNRQTGFIGSKVKSEDEKTDITVNCSEYDKIILIFRDGVYKVVPVMDKLFIGENLLFMGVVSKKLIFNVIYRSGLENRSFVKRFKMPTFINNREYRLFPEHKRSIIQLLVVGEKDIRGRVSFAPSARARYNSEEIEFNEYLIKQASAKGKRIGNRVVRRVSNQTGKARKKMPSPAVLPGMDKTTTETD